MAAAASPGGLTDTDILIDASRGLAVARTFLAQQRSVGVRISIISAMELVAGSRNAPDLARIRRFLRATTALPISSTISQTAYGLMTSFFLSHHLLIPDALIAATALEHRLELHTKKTRDFRMIPGLVVTRPP